MLFRSKYLTKFVHCRDELGSVGINIDDEDLVSLALLGLLKSWHSYEDCQWTVETARMGATLIGSCAGGDKAKYQG